MKQITVYVAILALFLVGDRLMGGILAGMVESSQFRYSRLYSGRAEADVLLIGNSRGLTFFQPHIESKTGLRTCNLSYNGLPADLAEALVKDYIDRYPAVRTLVIDVTLADRENASLISGFLPYAHSSARIDSLIRKMSPDAWRGARVSRLFRYNNEVFQRAFYYRSLSDEDWLLDRQIEPALAATAPLDTFPLSVEPKFIAHLAAMTQYARSKGLTVQLVVSPYYPGMVRDWQPLDAFCAEVERACGQTVRNYSRLLTDTRDFGDLMHPNRSGAIRYIDQMIDDGVLTR